MPTPQLQHDIPSYTCAHCGFATWDHNEVRDRHCPICRQTAADLQFRASIRRHSSHANASLFAGQSGLRIVSEGTAAQTYLLDMLGQKVKLGMSLITGIQIDPIKPGGVITAHVTLENVELDLAVLPPYGEKQPA